MKPIRESDIVPGSTEPTVTKGAPPTADALWMTIGTTDQRLDDLFGIRPLRLAGRVLTALAPANVIRNVAGIPKPSEVVEDLSNEVESKLRGLRKEWPRKWF